MKKLLVFGVLMSIAFTSFSQKRVSGYYRKNGTYVSSYTRGGSSSYSGGVYSSSSNEEKEETPKEQFGQSTLKVDGDGFNVYVSVLKYYDQTIDVQQATKKYSFYEITHKDYKGRYDNLGDVEYTFNSNKISQEETLRLVSEYGWTLNNGLLTKKIYSDIPNKFPSFLTHSFEIVKLK
jgi:hypothetical protein